MPALYPSLVGASWSQLAPPVQRLHAVSACARGLFCVRRGRGFAARLLATLLGMPKATEGAPVSLAIERAGDFERWIRTFSDRALCTSQWRSGDLLVESMGLVQCWFRLRAADGALIFDQVRATLGVRGFAVPLPRWLAPRIEGHAGPEPEAVRVSVRVHAPLIGLVIAYEGSVTPEGSP
jgi:hypothetical protein